MSVVAIRENAGRFSVAKVTAFDRPVPVERSGPVRGSALVVTRYSPGGTMTRGTINDCASGYTPVRHLPHFGAGLYESNWPGNGRGVAAYGPGGATARPRSATLLVTKNDGGPVGL